MQFTVNINNFIKKKEYNNFYFFILFFFFDFTQCRKQWRSGTVRWTVTKTTLRDFELNNRVWTEIASLSLAPTRGREQELAHHALYSDTTHGFSSPYIY
jgi:hypothetical protein